MTGLKCSKGFFGKNTFSRALLKTVANPQNPSPKRAMFSIISFLLKWNKVEDQESESEYLSLMKKIKFWLEKDSQKKAIPSMDFLEDT